MSRWPTASLTKAYAVFLVILWTTTLCGYYVDRIFLENYHVDIALDDDSNPQHKMCDSLTAYNREDLVIQEPHFDLDGAEKSVRKHGSAIFPNVLSPELVVPLREAILKANEKDGSEPEQKGRNAQWLSVHDDPVIVEALKEIVQHPILRPIMDRVLGPNAALGGFSSFITLPGTAPQQWHADTLFPYSARSQPELFLPAYSLVVSLQNTTSEMGATLVCPGTQKCHNVYNRHACFPATLGAGEALLWSQDMYHRGGAHVNLNGPDRIMLFLKFFPSRNATETRHLPESRFQMHWQMFGHTLNDVATIDKRPWTAWQAVGLSPFNKNPAGYSFISYVLDKVANELKPHPQQKLMGIEITIKRRHVERFWLQCFVLSCRCTALWFACFAVQRLLLYFKSIDEEHHEKKVY